MRRNEQNLVVGVLECARRIDHLNKTISNMKVLSNPEELIQDVMYLHEQQVRIWEALQNISRLVVDCQKDIDQLVENPEGLKVLRGLA